MPRIRSKSVRPDPERLGSPGRATNLVDWSGSATPRACTSGIARSRRMGTMIARLPQNATAEAAEKPLREPEPEPADATSTRYAAQAIDALRSAGLRITRPRRSIVELLERADRPLTAAGIHEQLKRRRIAIDLASVYRSLAILEEYRLIHRLASVEGVVRCEPGFEASACHHHLVCRQCGAVREVECDGQIPLRARVEGAYGFHVEAHAVELTGLCRACYARG